MVKPDLQLRTGSTEESEYTVKRRWHYRLLARVLLGSVLYLIFLFDRRLPLGVVNRALLKIEAWSHGTSIPLRVDSFWVMYLLTGISLYLYMMGGDKKRITKEAAALRSEARERSKRERLDKMTAFEQLGAQIAEDAFKKITPDKGTSLIINVVFRISIVVGWPLLVSFFLGAVVLVALYAAFGKSGGKRVSSNSPILVLLIFIQVALIKPMWKACVFLAILIFVNSIVQ